MIFPSRLVSLGPRLQHIALASVQSTGQLIQTLLHRLQLLFAHLLPFLRRLLLFLLHCLRALQLLQPPPLLPLISILLSSRVACHVPTSQCSRPQIHRPNPMMLQINQLHTAAARRHPEGARKMLNAQCHQPDHCFTTAPESFEPAGHHSAILALRCLQRCHWLFRLVNTKIRTSAACQISAVV